MKTTRLALGSALILLGFVASGSALAGPHGHGHHGHGHARFSVFVGAPFGWYGYGSPFGWYGYGYYPPPYSYYPPYYAPVVTVPYTPPTYIEQGGQQAAPAPQTSPASQNYWYYCADSKSYYPYVNQCPGGWQRVSPTPPGG